MAERMMCSVAERAPAQLVEPMLTARESAVPIGSIVTTGSSDRSRR